MLNIIKRIMAKLKTRKFVPTPDEAAQGATPMNSDELLAALAAYKAQNPAKYEMKKAALFKMYGLEDPEEKARLEEEARIEALAEEKAAKKVAEKAAKKDKTPSDAK